MQIVWTPTEFGCSVDKCTQLDTSCPCVSNIRLEMCLFPIIKLHLQHICLSDPSWSSRPIYHRCISTFFFTNLFVLSFPCLSESRDLTLCSIQLRGRKLWLCKPALSCFMWELMGPRQSLSSSVAFCLLFCLFASLSLCAALFETLKVNQPACTLLSCEK